MNKLTQHNYLAYNTQKPKNFMLLLLLCLTWISNHKIAASGALPSYSSQEFRVSSYNTIDQGSQKGPSIARLTDGGFVIAWSSQYQAGGVTSIQAKLFISNGTNRTDEFRVNQDLTHSHYYPSVAGLTNGGFVIAWGRYDSVNMDYDLYARVFDANGSATTNDIPVNTFTTGNQNFPSIAGLTDGGFIITWHSCYVDTFHIYARIFDSNGTPRTGEYQCDQSGGGRPSITGSNDGGFVVAWVYEVYGNVVEIRARMFDSNGAAKASEFTASNSNLNTKDSPSITTLNDGSFAVTWQCYYDDGYQGGIFSRMFDSSGTATTGVFLVNQVLIHYDQQAPSIAGLADGGLVITWMSNLQDGYNNGIYARIFNSSGMPLTDELLVNTVVQYEQQYPSIAGLNDGGYAITWTSNYQYGTVYEGYARVFDIYQCTVNDDCLSNLTQPVCDLSIHKCRPCNESLACSSPLFCNLNTGTCEQCLSNQNCTADPAYPVCDLSDHTCKPCDSNRPCSLPKSCNLATGKCEECVSDANCSSLTSPICDSSTYTCQPCSLTLPCSLPKYCNVLSGKCEECTSNTHCVSNLANPVCDLSAYTCKPCSPSLPCTPPKLCNLGTGKCEECLSDSDCSSNVLNPVCNLTTHICQPCNINLPCSSPKSCHLATGTCEECISNTNCSISLANPVCDLSIYQCRPCNASSPCSSPKSCNINTGRCEECVSNANCSTNLTHPVCDLSKFACQPCSNSLPCPSGKVCNIKTGRCEECLSTSDCSNNINAPVCDLSDFKCHGCNNTIPCPSSKICSLSVGRCEECLTNAHCSYKKNTPICDYMSFKCRACNQSSECPYPTICDRQTGSCEICLSNDNCAYNLSYPICNLTTHQCEQEAVTIMSAGNLVVYTYVAVTVPMFLINPIAAWGLMKIFQRFFYLQFWNIDWPANLEGFLMIFALGRLAFLPNIADFSFIGNIEIESPKKFYDRDYTGFFLHTTGHCIFLWAIILLLYPVIYQLDRYFSKRSLMFKNKEIFKKFKEEFILSTWDASVSDIFYGALLQLSRPPGSSGIMIISYAFAIFGIALSIFTFIKSFLSIRRQPPSIPSNRKWLPLVFYCFQIIQPCSMVLFYEYPMHQLGFLWGFNIFTIAIYLPYVKYYWKQTLLEVIYFFIHLLLTFAVYSNISKNTKDSLGQTTIILCCVFVALEFVGITWQQLKFVKNSITYCLSKPQKQPLRMKSNDPPLKEKESGFQKIMRIKRHPLSRGETLKDQRSPKTLRGSSPKIPVNREEVRIFVPKKKSNAGSVELAQIKPIQESKKLKKKQ